MIEIYKYNFTDELERVDINGLELSEPVVCLLREILWSLIGENIEKTFFFQFRREDGFNLDENELCFYRDFIPNYFKTNGGYSVVYRRNERIFDGFGWLKRPTDIVNMAIWALRYYYAVSIFSPENGLTWDYLLDNYKEFTNVDIGGEKLLSQGYADWIFFNGLGFGNISVVYKNGLKIDKFEEVLKKIGIVE